MPVTDCIDIFIERYKSNNPYNISQLHHLKIYNFKNNSWKNNLYFLLKHNFKINEIFSASDIYNKCENFLHNIYPNSNTIRASIRANMQYLRDDGSIIFVSRGTYKFK